MRLGNRYVLGDPIAAGGMAQVWAATDVILDEAVAIKILHPHLSTNDKFIERFRREAVAAASLNHESIVAVHDTISVNGIEAIVMELIVGRTLRAELDEVGAMSASEVMTLGVHVAEALAEAHKTGLVHRDIKPANIMMADDDRILVADFGIAKAGTDGDLTATGTLLGTAKYLAPEQVTGGGIDPRSDLYALGVVMYESLTGSAPFKANTDAATALARLHSPAPDVRSVRPNVAPALASVVARLMARDPQERYAQAEDVASALRGIARANATAAEEAELARNLGASTIDFPASYDALDPTVLQTPQDREPTAAQQAISSTQPLPPAESPVQPSSDGGRRRPPQPPPNPAYAADGVAPPKPPQQPAPAVAEDGAGGQPNGQVGSVDAGRPRPPDPPSAYRRNRPPANSPAQGFAIGPNGRPPDQWKPPAHPGQASPSRSGPGWSGALDGGQTASGLGGGTPSTEYEVLGIDPPGSQTELSSDRVIRSGRSRVIPVLVVSLIVAALLVAGSLLTDIGIPMMGGSGDDNPLDEAGTGLPIVSVASFDPESNDPDKQEREEITGLAIDGDRTTAWTTESYRRANLGGLKSGVGLQIGLGQTLPLNRIELQTNSEGWVAEFYVGDSFSEDGSDWGTPVATVELGGGEETVGLARTEGSMILLWIRDTGRSGERFRFELAEVIVR